MAIFPFLESVGSAHRAVQQGNISENVYWKWYNVVQHVVTIPEVRRKRFSGEQKSRHQLLRPKRGNTIQYKICIVSAQDPGVRVRLLLPLL